MIGHYRILLYASLSHTLNTLQSHVLNIGYCNCHIIHLIFINLKRNSTIILKIETKIQFEKLSL